ncbi:hypothetical protein BGX31_006516 [Mortierella sp. GBA43]|nr:hypothetical protein BGX31_006516 [Mortierella sp. GBA43]
MDQFVVEEELGNGSFGAVFRARHKESGELVAIKKMKKRFTSHGECRSLQEVKALDALRSGPNIVRLHHYFLEKKELHMVFELMDGNMYQLIRNQNGQKLEESRIRSMVFQVLRGLQHMHSKGVMHRDMKPENLLVSGDNVKIADFGLARELKSRPPYTTYVSTRWYRAPEVVLKSSAYSCAVDVWAVGTIAAELTSLRPLFPGKSDVDQLSRMGGVLGSPAPRPLPTDDATTTATDSPNTNPPAYGAGGEWKDGVQLATRMGFTFPTVPVRTLREILPNASEESLELITGLLQYDPKTRLSAYQALHGSWFKDMPEVEELKHLTDVVQQSPDKRRSMFSGLLKKEGKDRKRGFSISITGQNGAEKPSLAVLILKPATPTPHQLSGNSTIPDPTAPQEQHREQSNTPSSSSESQLQPSTNLDTAFDLPIISPISPFWKES